MGLLPAYQTQPVFPQPVKALKACEASPPLLLAGVDGGPRRGIGSAYYRRRALFAAGAAICRGRGIHGARQTG